MRKYNPLRFLMILFICLVLPADLIEVYAQVTGNPPQTSLPQLADGGALGSGKLNFQPDLFTGRFTYGVPIEVPPGRQNSQPSIGLQYNSSVGNGWCGVGWKLELGKIERETRYGVPVLWPTNGSPTQYDDGKSFTVDFGGVEGHLVKVSTNGLSPVEYRLMVDKTYLKFLYYNNVSNAYWMVADKGGKQFFFGEASSNRVDNPNLTRGYGTNTFRWDIDRIVDANGNATYVVYTNITLVNALDTNAELCPLQISYNANTNAMALSATDTIKFIYTNRTDQAVSFISGFRLESRVLLSQIAIQTGSQKVRRYVFGYTNSPSTLRSLLTSVMEFGSDDVSLLPPLTFSYQVEQFGFGPLQSWGGVSSQGQTNDAWNSLSYTTNGYTYVSMIDIDGDGLPDRVMIKTNSPYNSFVVQRNNGTNLVGKYQWGGLTNQGNTNMVWGSVMVLSNSITSVDLFDINGDGRPDRVMADFNSTNDWKVQLNAGVAGNNSFSTSSNWATLAGGFPDIHSELYAGIYYATEEMADLNGDGLVDRLFGQSGMVQFNTGHGFGPKLSYSGITSTIYYPGNSGQAATPSYLPQYNGGQSAAQSLIDINGDGLPDIVGTIYANGAYCYIVAYNDGTQLESPNTNFIGNLLAPLGSEGFTNQNNAWNSSDYSVDESSGMGNMVQMVRLIDINGDGLPDRVLTKAYAPYDRFKVQLNTGTGFGPLVDWTNVLSEFGSATNGQPWDSINYITNGQLTVAMMDINGDGLPDRVMRKLNPPYTNYEVQLNLGPFPDLLCKVDNGTGGKVYVTYVPSTKYDNTDRNWTNDPWAEGAKSLLPFPVYTVSTIAVDDGFGNISTNTYAYKHGMFDPVWRDFHGFNSVAVTDPYGAKTVTYFHQSGGFDDSANGEFQDQGSFSKKGTPYRVETWGTNGLLYQMVLNKVQEYVLNTNGWYFSCVTQTVVMNYEGLSSYRAIAKQFSYDTNTENMIAEADLGEVTNIVFNGQTFTDVGGDSLYQWITYTNIGNIRNRPVDTKVTSDSAGATRLRESAFAYDANGNLKLSQSWLDTAGAFVLTASNSYDQFGNVTQTVDAAGVTNSYVYDSTLEQYPVTQTSGLFSSSATFDPRSGRELTATDIKGLVSSNSYDVFFRPTASYISTNAYGSPTLWQSRTYYSLGGISNGVSYNFVHSQVNDAVDSVNGYETYGFNDGLGRSIESRAEAETGQFRVGNTVYDLRGKPAFQTLTYFSSGTNYTKPSGTYLGSSTEYDSIGRSFRTTPSVQGTFNSSGLLTGTSATGGDTGSPVGPASMTFVDGSNPWATVVTDSLGKTKKSYRDAYDRTVRVVDVTTNGNYTTTFGYDVIGNLTNVTDNANNSTRMGYDSFGQKTAMLDPDMGAWSYVYDHAGRMTQQTDARTNTLKFFYADALGRLTSKQIFNAANTLVGTITYAYDASDDPNYTVYPGQVYKVTDLQGYQRSSYDVRGRVLKSGRYLNANTMEYVTQSTYDNADRVQQLTYPGGAAILKYSYDTAGHLAQVKSLAGTGTQVIFYTPGAHNALDQLAGYTNGNGVVTAYGYFANSARLQSVTAAKNGTNYQNLTYTYDNASNLKSVSDGVYSGSASAALGGITYDDLYRVVSLSSTARGAKVYNYDTIGNLLTNQDFGFGGYHYGTNGVLPHAVMSADGVSYGYDACGNMTTRGGQTLGYDAENQLVRVATTNDTVLFGYDASGERLWRAGTNGYSVWIGGIYEINNGKVLCHVVAGGQLVATFEPLCGGLWSKALGEDRWHAAATTVDAALAWPFRDGRGRMTVFAGTWTGILALCLAMGRGVRLRRYEYRRWWRWGQAWRQLVTLTVLAAFVGAGTGNVEAATYSPVFYYYHADQLGSSNVLTDRAGNVVQHYEYGTFGQQSFVDNGSAYPVSNRYTGQVADDETGLYYYGGRYYDPQLGRFIQPDPTVPDPTDSQSLNRYSYCRNNPLNETDPTGFDDSGGGDLSMWSAINGPNSFSAGVGRGQDFPVDSPPDGFHQSVDLLSMGTPIDYSAINNGFANGNPDGMFPAASFDNPVSAPPGGTWNSWLNGSKTALDIASNIPGPIGTASSLISAGINLVQGNYAEVGTSLAIAAVAGIGLGLAAKAAVKAIEAARAARAAKMAESLAARAAKNTAADGSFYSVAFEMKLNPSSYPGVLRPAHFQEANEALLTAMEGDAKFAQTMQGAGVNLSRTPTGLAPRTSPAGWTWHHAEKPGVMQLVPRSQHAPGSIFQDALHPGGQGGFSIWGQ